MGEACERWLFQGRVQGVGFRATARRLAAAFRVSGFVRNRHDGTVELVARGEPDELDRFREAIGREMQSRVRSVSVEPTAPPNDLPLGFEIAPTT